jgi:hypothetical protein
MKIGWSTDFIVVDGEKCAADELNRLQRSGAEWVLVERDRGSLRYVFGRHELLKLPHLIALVDQGADLTAMTLNEALGLREGMASVPVVHSSEVRELASDPARPSAARFVEMERGHPVAVGGADVLPRPKMRSARSASPPPLGTSRGSATPAPLAPAGQAASQAPVDDEGTTPVRFPSIQPDGAVKSGAPITLIVDLLRAEDAQTLGATMFPQQAADWEKFEVEVLLQSPAIDFDEGGRGKLTVHRNAASVAAHVNGRVHPGLAAGTPIDVKAKFLMETRFCGAAVRRLEVDGQRADAPPADAGQGAVQVDNDAEKPDLTVFITVFDRDAPGRLHWRLVTRTFPGLPPKLDGLVNLGQNPAAEATLLFKQFAKLERGAHCEAIEGFGEELWRRAPAEFQAAYWALHDHYRRPLTIQFVSDDPHLPWELMSPYRDGEVHGPIALKHAVARWIGHWQGYMPNRLPKGTLVAIAPHYKTASAQLSLAEAAAQGLVDKLGAQRVGGTRQALLALLEKPPAEPVALLYFTGHGAFAADAAGASLIKLEEGANLSAVEVMRQRVLLGERFGTVVFLNACEVGATASVLGNVGGWADAFLSRKFGAFIAPLWAIDEEDAKQVTEELMTRIVTEHQPMGAALRDLRSKHGAVSPTFYSYLLYGDVTARLGTA